MFLRWIDSKKSFGCHCLKNIKNVRFSSLKEENQINNALNLLFECMEHSFYTTLCIQSRKHHFPIYLVYSHSDNSLVICVLTVSKSESLSIKIIPIGLAAMQTKEILKYKFNLYTKEYLKLSNKLEDILITILVISIFTGRPNFLFFIMTEIIIVHGDSAHLHSKPFRCSKHAKFQ